MTHLTLFEEEVFMEDFIAYFILGIVFLWFFRNTYKKIKGQNDASGCSGGCGGCNTTSDSCADSTKLYDRKL